MMQYLTQLTCIISWLFSLVEASNITTEMFKSKSCSQSDSHVIMTSLKTGNVSKSITTTNKLNCAVSCSNNRDCIIASFHASNRTCHHYSKDNAYKDDALQLTPRDGNNNNNYSAYHQANSSDEDNNDNDCWVLFKQTYYNDNDHTDFDENLKIWNNFTFLPISTIKNGSEAYTCTVSPVSNFVETPDGFLVTERLNNLAQYLDRSQFSSPVRESIRIYTEEPLQQYRYVFDLKGVQYNVAVNLVESLSITKRSYLDQSGKRTGVVVADSVSALRDALLKGFRRVDTEPARCVIDAIENDVHYDVTETLALENTDLPIYVTSFKDSVKSGKRYLFRHQRSEGISLAFEEKDQTFPWVLETTWTKLELSANEEEARRQLKDAFLEGREARVVLNNEISTDVTGIQLTSSDIIASLAKYLIPFKGVESVAANEQQVRFPVISFSGLLAECDMEFQGFTVYNNTTRDFSSPSNTIDWYFSTTNWTKAFEITSDRTVVFGDKETLRTAVSEGRKMRLCLETLENNVLCHGALALYTKTRGADVVFQSTPIMTVETDLNGRFERISDSCTRVIHDVFASGKCREIKFEHRAKDTTLNFVRQIWFVEYDHRVFI